MKKLTWGLVLFVGLISMSACHWNHHRHNFTNRFDGASVRVG